MTTGWKLLIVVLLLAGAGLGGYRKGHTDGVGETTTAWQTRENGELREANKTILRLTSEAQATETAHAQRLVQASATYQESLEHEKQINRDRVAAARAGTYRLRDPAAPSLKACSGASGQAAAAAGGRDGEAAGELSGAAAEFLLDLTSEANAVVHQLTAAQAVIVANQQACGSAPPSTTSQTEGANHGEESN